MCLGDTWREADLVDLQAYVGRLILAGVYCSNHEATKSLWDAESGGPIFPFSYYITKNKIQMYGLWVVERGSIESLSIIPLLESSGWT